MMRNPASHIEAAIVRAIIAEADACGMNREKPVVIVEEICSTDWASATFVGSTVEIQFRLEGEPALVAAAALEIVKNLPVREFTIPRQIVADLAVEEGDTRAIADDSISKNLIVNALVIRD